MRLGAAIDAAGVSRAWQHPWLRMQRLIRSILEVRRDAVTRPVMKARPAARRRSTIVTGPHHESHNDQ